jgi:exopolysaccharide production protein ExoF
MSDLRRSQVAQKRDMAQLEDQRKKDALTQLQQQDIKIGKLLEQRKAAEDQLLLTTNFAAQALRENTQILEYSIHRRADDGVKDVTVTSLSDVLPGDVVLVKVRKPEPSGVADQAAERPKTPG